jgi:hypothetical protein
MTISTRDRRALMLLAAATVVMLVYYFWPASPAAPVVGGGPQSPQQAEQRLERLRESAATVPAKEKVLKDLTAQLAQREKGLLQADTAAQAQAQLIQIMRKLAGAENPPIEVRATELGGIAATGDAYGSVTVAMQMDCRIEQLVNLLSAISQLPELVSPTDLRITSASPKNKAVGVRLSVAALVPRKLIPEKGKGGAL